MSLVNGYFQNKAMGNKDIKKEKYYHKIQLNVPMHGYKAGQTVYIKSNANGVPLRREWRNRFRDVTVDQSFTFIKNNCKKQQPIDTISYCKTTSVDDVFVPRETIEETEE